jgi:hypothetical protein
LAFWQRPVGEHETANRKRMVLSIAQLCARGKGACKRRPNEAGSAGDDDFHAIPGELSRAGSGSADLI